MTNLKKIKPTNLRDSSKGKNLYCKTNNRQITRKNIPNILRLYADGTNFCFVEAALQKHNFLIIAGDKSQYLNDIKPLNEEVSNTSECRICNLNKEKSEWYYANSDRVKGKPKGEYNYHNMSFLVLELVSGTILLMKIEGEVVLGLKQ